VDIAIFTIDQGRLKVVLVERSKHPFKGFWALPGGFVDLKKDPDIHTTARRKLISKTGVDAPLLEQVSTIGNGHRDPRHWSITTLYMALIPYAPTDEFIEAVNEARWFPIEEMEQLQLAFDHSELLKLARERLKNKTAYTVLPIHVLKRPLSLTQLHKALELLMDTALEKKSFRRRLLNAKVVKEVGEGIPDGGKGRPAALHEPADGSENHLFVSVSGD
jgi:ADP-ribose pyrophosphatase